jgi:hypothetical protein
LWLATEPDGFCIKKILASRMPQHDLQHFDAISTFQRCGCRGVDLLPPAHHWSRLIVATRQIEDTKKDDAQ